VPEERLEIADLVGAADDARTARIARECGQAHHVLARPTGEAEFVQVLRSDARKQRHRKNLRNFDTEFVGARLRGGDRGH